MIGKDRDGSQVAELDEFRGRRRHRMKLIIAFNVGICKNTPQPQAFVLPWRGEAVQRHHRAIGVPRRRRGAGDGTL